MAESDFNQFQTEFEERFKDKTSKALEIRAQRTKAAVEGVWDVTITPSIAEHPIWKEFKAKLAITNSELKVEAKVRDLKTADQLHYSGMKMESSTSGFGVRQEWSVRYIRILRQIQGTLADKHDDEIDVYSIVGTAIAK